MAHTLATYACRIGMARRKPSETGGEVLSLQQDQRHLFFDSAIDRPVVRLLPFFLKPECDLPQIDAFRFGALAKESPQLAVGRFAQYRDEAVSLRSGQGKIVNAVVRPAERAAKTCLFFPCTKLVRQF